MGICKFSKLSFLLIFVSSLFNLTIGQDTDRPSLLSFMSGIVSDPQNSLNNWNSSQIHFCNWVGIKCDIRGEYRVTELDLSGKSLTGTISPAIADLSSLTILDLAGNFFHGKIPPEIGSLSSLTQLSLSSNHLEGKIPSQLGNLHRLVYLSLGSNDLSGEIPETLFCNGSFQYIDFSNNSFNGEIPLNNQCQLKQLRFLLLWSNQFSGQIPKALSNSSNLQWLDLESNFFSGELPAEVVCKMANLQVLYLSYNSFITHNDNTNLEPFFFSLTNSSNLQELELAGNNLRGQLPPIIGSLSSSNLKEIHLHDNLIHGPIPSQISNLFNLSLLNLSNNFMNGSIPSDLNRLKKLERLYLSNNSLSGEIPAGLGQIQHLGLLDLSKNILTGQIPDSFINVSQLRTLLLHENQLSGTIPPSLGNCVNLEILDVSHNRISGQIPREVVLGLTSLKMFLNLSNNRLEGTIPWELSKMDMVLSIDLSFNKLSKTIPPQLSTCIALETLYLSNNMLEGSLPDSIVKLPYLKELDVSSNRLTGEIPWFLLTNDSTAALTRLNLSFNDFHGNVSDKGRFTAESFVGNPRLCGSIDGMKSCRNRKKTHHVLVLPIIISLLCMLVLCVLVCYYLSLKAKFFRRRVTDEEKAKEPMENKFPRISCRQLIEATDGFSGLSLVGSGSYGHVYKGTLKDKTRIAVKVLNSNTTGEISGSFERECQVLKRTRHRNLIRILTICSRPDFKALVFPLMSNGSLEDHLYIKNDDGLGRRLDLVELVGICSDVSEGLAYLHHHSPVRVVHCDLKPSNILLDDDLTALVTDFGIARLVMGEQEDDFTHSSDGLLCGTVGYIAPEYGVGRRVSIEGDVYSFGILILEIVMGKRPTDEMFHQGSNLHDWVRGHYPERVEPLVEEVLERCRPQPNRAYDARVWREVVIELIELGLACTQYDSFTRPTMLDVAEEMLQLKSYISSISIGQ